MSGIYNENGQIILTEVVGNTFVGIYNPKGTFNGVDVTNTTSFVGLYHASGAFNFSVVEDPTSPLLNPNGSFNVISNGDGTFSFVSPKGVTDIPIGYGVLMLGLGNILYLENKKLILKQV